MLTDTDETTFLRRRVEQRFPTLINTAMQRFPLAQTLVQLMVFLSAVRRLSRTCYTTDAEIIAFVPTRNNRKAVERIDTLLTGRSIDMGRARTPFSALTAFCGNAITSLRQRRNVPQVRGSVVARLQYQQFLAAYFLFRNSLRQQASIVAVGANDHSPLQCGFYAAAQQAGMKLVYIQHAHVTGVFPPLKFDLSLLFGQRARDTYAAKGSASRTLLVGSGAVGDRLRKKLVFPDGIQVLGIALTNVSISPGVWQCIAQIREATGAKRVLVRLHPAFRGEVGAQPDVEISRGAPILDDLRRIDLLVSGTSSIMIEALKHRVPVAYCVGLDDIGHDYYGFVKAGVVPELEPAAAACLDAVAAHYQRDWQARAEQWDLSVSVDDADLADQVNQQIRKLQGRTDTA